MKQHFTKIVCGFAAATLAFSLTACDDSSSSASGLDGFDSEDISSESKGSENIESSDAAGNSSASKENSSTSLGGNSSANPGEGSSSSKAVISSNSLQTCAHITDAEGTGADKWKCSEPEFSVAQDCEKQIYYMCVENRWVKVEDCDPAKDKCGFDNYAMCRVTRSKTFCIDSAWVKEPCDPETHGYERTLYTYDEPENPQNTSFTQMRYFCENGAWVAEKDVFNCGSMMDCGGRGY